MGRMIRKQIYIAPEQEALLKRLADETGMSEADLIRQALDRQAKSLRFPRRDLRYWREELEFIAALRQRGPVEGHRTWSREELHER